MATPKVRRCHKKERRKEKCESIGENTRTSNQSHSLDLSGPHLAFGRSSYV